MCTRCFCLLPCYLFLWCVLLFFFFKHKTAYEVRISDWSSDVCSSDLGRTLGRRGRIPWLRRPRGRCRGPSPFRSLSATCRYISRTGQIGRASCRERVCQYV